MRLIDADALREEHCNGCAADIQADCKTDPVCASLMWVDEAPTVEAIFIPCKIGDLVWAIRNYKGVKHPQQGKVEDMYFTPDMRLNIVVKHIARGEWGKTVFPTYETASEAISGR